MVLTIALVFAMSGGAYAAKHYLITSTKQISPSVLKTLQGKAGAPGAKGDIGPEGKPGSPGTAGAQGLVGKEGPEGKAGKDGKDGKDGSPWTAGGTLPSGATETGEIAIAQERPEANDIQRAAVSFTIPLKATVKPHFVGVGEGEGEPDVKLPAGCTGNSQKPAAEPGNLCVFAKDMEATKFVLFFDAGSESTTATGLTGDTLFLRAEHIEPFTGFVETAQLLGTWAVTAE
ncbi:MAG TPA: collagen-like protein [Solirubrobacteraceae bacterium]